MGKKGWFPVFLVLAAGIGYTFLVAPDFFTEPAAGGRTTSRSAAASALVQPLNGDVDIPSTCGDGGLALKDVVAVSASQELHAAPDATSPKIKNEKASQILGRDDFHRIDSSTTVRRLCVQTDWTEVQIVTPNWLTHIRGWVPSHVLREIMRTETGSRIYVESDFLWYEDTLPYKAELVAVVNKIAQENRNCVEIDTASLAQSPSRSRPGDPVFFISCVSGKNAFNLWFRPGEVDAQSFRAKEPLPRARAVELCEMAAKQAAVHPSTVSFSRIRDLTYLPHVSGRARVVSTFTAKNTLNLELKYRIDCLFDEATLMETNIAEELY